MSTLGEYIAEKRTALGLSQRELAKKCKLSQTTIQKIETGETISPGVDVLVSMAKALKVPAYSLLLVYQGKTPNLEEIVDGEALRVILYQVIDKTIDEHFPSKAK